MESFKEAVDKAIKTYNKYRSPEATAKLVEMKDGELIIDFEGSFCRTCGVSEYFEDFIYELKGLVDVRMEILNFEYQGYEKFRVRYAVKDT
ncbi:MAG: hypothetical protein ACE5IF_06415 [Candidatus Bathyarchaeia archaeon]